MSIDIHTNVRPRAKERPEITHQNRNARVADQIARARLYRDISRCPCGHGQAVHTETGCEMDDCRCKSYKG